LGVNFAGMSFLVCAAAGLKVIEMATRMSEIRLSMRIYILNPAIKRSGHRAILGRFAAL
jgi:hypothetical protein